MKEKDAPFIIINEQGIHVHPELIIIFTFLMEIEKEIKELLSYEERLIAIRKQVQEIIGASLIIAENTSLDFEFTESPATLSDKLKFLEPIRCELIVLFAHMETIRCLYTAYEKETSNDKAIRTAKDEDMDKFINQFMLSHENEWVIKNKTRSGKMSAKNIRGLRNSLTHFFSVDKTLGIVPEYDELMDKVVKKTNNKVQALSPKDFEEMLTSAARILLKKWASDCQKSIDDKNDNFLQKIMHVKKLVEKNAAHVLHRNEVSDLV